MTFKFDSFSKYFFVIYILFSDFYLCLGDINIFLILELYWPIYLLHLFQVSIFFKVIKLRSGRGYISNAQWRSQKKFWGG